MRIERRRAGWRFSAAAVAVVALLSCGFGRSREADDSSGGAEPVLPDPCTLLTPAEVAEVQGGPTDAGIPATGRPRSNPGCVFGQTNDGKLTTITVFAGDQARFEAEREVVAQNFEVEDIPGLGDAAFIGAEVLHVRKGELIMTLFTGSPTAEEERDKALKLAPKALARM
jgi:hypothetical protein